MILEHLYHMNILLFSMEQTLFRICSILPFMYMLTWRGSEAAGSSAKICVVSPSLDVGLVNSASEFTNAGNRSKHTSLCVSRLYYSTKSHVFVVSSVFWKHSSQIKNNKPHLFFFVFSPERATSGCSAWAPSPLSTVSASTHDTSSTLWWQRDGTTLMSHCWPLSHGAGRHRTAALYGHIPTEQEGFSHAIRISILKSLDFGYIVIWHTCDVFSWFKGCITVQW